MMKTILLSCASLVWLFLLVGPATAGEEMTLRGMVREIDRESGTVVVLAHDGSDVTFIAEGRALSRIEKRGLRVDDDVAVTYVMRDGRPRALSIFRKPSG